MKTGPIRNARGLLHQPVQIGQQRRILAERLLPAATRPPDAPWAQAPAARQLLDADGPAAGRESAEAIRDDPAGPGGRSRAGPGQQPGPALPSRDATGDFRLSPRWIVA